jgi:hypothetical protein
MLHPQCPCGINAVRGYEYWGSRGATNQQRFITDDSRFSVGQDLDAIHVVSAIAPRNHAGVQAARTQMLDHSDHSGRLASAASDDVADHDHRYSGVL